MTLWINDEKRIAKDRAERPIQPPLPKPMTKVQNPDCEFYAKPDYEWHTRLNRIPEAIKEMSKENILILHQLKVYYDGKISLVDCLFGIIEYMNSQNESLYDANKKLKIAQK